MPYASLYGTVNYKSITSVMRQHQQCCACFPGNDTSLAESATRIFDLKLSEEANLPEVFTKIEIKKYRYR